MPPPMMEVSVKIRPPHRRGVQHSIFGIGEEEGGVGGGVVACKLFTNEHQPKFPFMYDKVFGVGGGVGEVYEHSVRHLLHSVLGGGAANLIITGQPCGQPYQTYLELILMSAEETLYHRPSAGYHVDLSHIIIHNEISMDANHPNGSSPMSLSTARRVVVGTLADITDTLPKDPTGHHITTIFVSDGMREGRLCFVYLSPTGGKQAAALQIFSKVFNGLASQRHVPFRESKVTSLLRSTLTATTPMLHLTCVATTPNDFYVTLSGLKAANRIRSENPPFTSGPHDVHYPQPRHPHGISRLVGGGGLAGPRTSSPSGVYSKIDVGEDQGVTVHEKVSPVLRSISPVVAPAEVVIPHVVEKEKSLVFAATEEMMVVDNKEEPSWSTLQRDIRLLSSEVEALKGEGKRGDRSGVVLDRALKSQERETARLLREQQELSDYTYLSNDIRPATTPPVLGDDNPFMSMYKQAEQSEAQFLRNELHRVSSMLHRERKGKVVIPKPTYETREQILGLAAVTSEAQQNYIEKLEMENKTLRSMHLSNMSQAVSAAGQSRESPVYRYSYGEREV